MRLTLGYCIEEKIEVSNEIDKIIKQHQSSHPIQPNAKTRSVIDESSEPIKAVNSWIKKSYDRNDNDQVM